jgi:ribosomal protein S18 acetylase RimI-like enzyme
MAFHLQGGGERIERHSLGRSTACRDARLADAPAIVQVWIDAWQAAYAGLMPDAFLANLDAKVALDRCEAALRTGQPALVIELDGAVVGFSTYGPSRDADDPHAGEVMAINLAPACWRRGLGKMLLAETVARLRQGNFTEATLWVVAGNTRARQFYEAQGWRADGHEKRDAQLTGTPLHEVRYRLRLARSS